MATPIETSVDLTPYAQARADIRDLVSLPLAAWMHRAPAHRRDRAFKALLSIPLDLGAAGYVVTVTQTERGWSIEVTGAIEPRVKLRLAGQARSYISALYQLADSAPEVIARLERKARKAAEERAMEQEQSYAAD